eukprot:gene19100-21725_t
MNVARASIAFRVLHKKATMVPMKAFHASAVTSNQQLVKKDDVGQLLGQAHNNVEYVVSKVDDL